MTRTRYGMLAGIAGAAFAAWWMRRQRAHAMPFSHEDRHGEVIFSNAPVAE
jgi:hypothetical protein